ncbi:MAG: hypothetical protein LQ349_006510 [Xanthoria aureola]|nr:MAG: hypothetical protein LQ349_006510 [Xanthoria aureola]
MASSGKAAVQPKTSASSSESAWRTKLAQRRGRLQYRTTLDGPWETMESSYEVEDIEEAHPEPPNIQEIILASTGIIVHQYSAKYNRAFTKELYEPLPGWELEFPTSSMKDFICEQRPVESWAENAPEGAKRIINAGGDAGGDAGATMEVDLKSEEFPLATLNLQKGMEIRLAFEGGATTRLDKGPYFWIWPMVTYILPGRHYKAADKTRNKMELNAWAEQNQTALSNVSMEKIHSDDGTAWRLRPKPHLENRAQPANPETPLAASRPIHTPSSRILKRRASVAFGFELPEKRECDTHEAKVAESERLLKGLRTAHERKSATEKELAQLQQRLAAEKRVVDDWQTAYLESTKDVQDVLEEDMPAQKRRA